VDYFDPKKVADYISLLVTDLNYAEHLGASSRKYVEENWNLKNGIDNIERYLIELSKKSITL
jgi:hypothetical protein